MFFDDEPEEYIKPSKQPIALKDYVERPVKQREYMTYEKLKSLAGGYLFCDIEIYSNYLLIAFTDYDSGLCYTFERTSNGDQIDSRTLYWIMKNCTVIGFNFLKFDLLVLWYAHSNPMLPLIKDLANNIIELNLRKSEFEQQYDIKIPSTRIVDLIEVAPLKGSLKAYGGRLHCERLQDLPFHPDQELTDDQKRIIRDYCFNDLDVTRVLFDALLDQLRLRDELSKEYNEDLMSKSDAQIAETVISREIERITGNRPERAEIEPGRVFNYKVPAWMRYDTPLMQHVLNTVATAPYTVKHNGRVDIPDSITDLKIRIGDTIYRMGNGGLHSSEKATAHVCSGDFRLIDRDVASYYPYIVLNSELYPEHLGTTFLTVYRTLVERRIAAKRAKNHTVADSLKIVINGSFGKLGSPHSVLYAPDLMIQVTLTGQLALLMLIEKLELNGIAIVSANTDGIVMKVPTGREPDVATIIKTWEDQTGFETEETEYTAVYSRDVNAYIAVKPDGTCKGKNVFFDPWSGGPKTAIFRFNKNPQHTICTEAVNAMLTVGKPLAQTIRECTDIKKFVCVRSVKGGGHKDGEYLGKVVRWYYAVGERGTINYVLNNNKVPDSDGARPLMDLPSSLPSDLNYAWYINKAQQMLIAIGHTRAAGELELF